ncbi:hypothetical protein ACF1GT_00080 [Streptomyces sp. NPDC014636]|uniref:hypothetical protein n=1 Tax=Streptomyces sp. NPDC014636 TaxID=3364876 RepID=UPI0036F64B2F
MHGSGYRAIYYRSPLAKIITGLLGTPDAPRPQTDTLTADIVRLKKADRTPRSQHAAEQREARATIAAYANHIQALSLRNAELEAENTTLREATHFSGWSASASSSHRACRTHTRCQRGTYRTTRCACPVRRAVHRAGERRFARHRARRPATALAARHRACARAASQPLLIFGSSTVKVGRARASTAGWTPHSSASTARPASLSTTSASARTPPPSCRAGKLRHVHSRSKPAAGRA